MRAYDNDRGAEALSEGCQVHYDLVRPHFALEGTTPGEAAGLTAIRGFRWLQTLKAAAETDAGSGKSSAESPA